MDADQTTTSPPAASKPDEIIALEDEDNSAATTSTSRSSSVSIQNSEDFNFNMKKDRVTERLKSLLALHPSQYESSECSADLRFLAYEAFLFEKVDEKRAIGDIFASYGATKLFSNIWKQNFRLDFVRNDDAVTNMRYIASALLNGTDQSVKLIEKIVEMKTYQDIFTYLSDEKFQPSEGAVNDNAAGLVGKCLVILVNCIQKYECRSAFREQKAVQICAALKDDKNNEIAIFSLVLLGFLVSEDENEMVHSKGKHFTLLVKMLGDCLTNDKHCSSQYGCEAIEITEALNRLAANEKNQYRIVMSDALPLYAKMLDREKFSAEENASAARGLWTLAFKYSSALNAVEGCIEGLKRIATEGKKAQKQAEGALWVLEGNGQQRMEILADTRTHDGTHVFISYSWSNKPMVHEVYQKLQKKGYKMWLDDNDMSGSTLEAMANAVEKAAVVIICFSQKYKQSPSCRTEAEYTYKQKKPIIPLKMDFGYTPDGWLGALIGNKLYFDFSTNEMFDDSFARMLEELDRKMPKHLNLSQDFVDGATLSDEALDVDPLMTKQEHGPTSASVPLLDADLLLELKYMYLHAPEAFYSSMKNDFGLSVMEVLKLTQILNGSTKSSLKTILK